MKMVGAFISFLVLLSAANVAGEVCSRVYPALSPGPQLKCEFEGSLGNPTQIGTTRRYVPPGARAQAQCRNSCLENTYCAAYSFNKRTGDCNQYPQKPTVQGIRGGNTGVYFWNRNCWQQNFTTGQALINPGFDSGSTSLQPWNRGSDNDSYLPTRAQPGSNGTAYSASMSVGTRIGTTSQYVSQSFTICPNTTYFIQPMYRYLGTAKTSNTTLNLVLSESNANGDGYCSLGSRSGIQLNTTTEWTTVLGPQYSWLTLQASGAPVLWAMSLSLEFLNNNRDGQNVSNPVLDRFQFDMNIAQTKTLVQKGLVTCGLVTSPEAGGNF